MPFSLRDANGADGGNPLQIKGDRLRRFWTGGNFWHKHCANGTAESAQLAQAGKCLTANHAKYAKEILLRVVRVFRG
jgi:hypothetical protein